MITSIELRNFKCFDRQTIELGWLTLLAGLNGSGKSSVLQALMLLRQSQPGPAGRWTLNGALVRLGTGADILFSQAEEERIELRLTVGNGVTLVWAANYERSADMLRLTEFPDEGTVETLPLFGNGFNYLAAERIGPRLMYETSDEEVEARQSVGVHGEYAAHFLDRYGSESIPDDAEGHPKATSRRLFDQVEAWLGELSPGVRISLTSHPRTDTVSVGFSFLQGKDVSNVFRATNVGFGLSYCLSLVVVLLSAQREQLLLIENPEAHVHPQGQAVIGTLLAKVAARGVQVIVETHSDHVLNGVRTAVFSRMCPADAVRMHFFSRPIEGSSCAARVESPRIDGRGRLNVRPDGFFDQWDKSLETLLGPEP